MEELEVVALVETQHENARLRTENDRLRAENEKLRQQIESDKHLIRHLRLEAKYGE